MQKLLNYEDRKKQGILRQVRNFLPVSNGSSSPLSCDYCVTPVPIGLGFLFGTALGLGLMGPDLGLGLDNSVL